MAFRQLSQPGGGGGGGGFRPLNSSMAPPVVISPPPQEPDYFGKGFVDFAKGVSNMGAHAAAGVGEGVGNVANFAGQVGGAIDPISNAQRINQAMGGQGWGYESPAALAGGAAQSGMKSLADTMRNNSDKLMGVSEGWGQAGDILGETANIVTGVAGGTGVANKLGGGLRALFPKAQGVMAQGSKIAPEAQSFLQKIIPTAQKAAGLAGQSAAGTQGVLATTEGRIATPADYAWGGATDLVGAGVGKILGGLAKKGLASIPQFTPTVKGQLGGKGMKRIGEIMYENLDEIPLTTSREKIGMAMTPLKKSTYGTVQDFIEQAQKRGAGSTTIDDLMADIKRGVISDKGAARAGLSLDEIPNAKAQLDEMQDFYENLYGGNRLDLNQAQQLKKNLRYKSGVGIDAATTAKNQFKEGVRGNVKTFIEDQVEKTLGKPAKEALQKANADYDVIKKLTNTLKKKTPYSGYLTDTISGSAGAAGALAQGNFGDAIKQAATAIGVKRAITSPAGKILFAQAVKKAPNKFISALAKGITLKLTEKPSQ